MALASMLLTSLATIKYYDYTATNHTLTSIHVMSAKECIEGLYYKDDITVY